MRKNTTPLQYDYEREVLIRIIGSKNPKEILCLLCPEMFANLTYRTIYRVCNELFENDGLIDIYALAKSLSGQDKDLVNSLTDEYTTSVNYKFYVEKLHQEYFKKISSTIRTPDDIKRVQAEIDRWQDVSAMEHISVNASQILCNYYDKWETAVKTGFKNLDDVLGSLQGGDFLIFAGATSSGKTMTALNLLLSMAKRGIKCNFYSLEMTKEQLVNRVISHETGINASKYRSFTLTDEDQKKHLKFSEDELPKLPINICTDYKGMTIDKIISIEKKSDSQIVFIDYLGLLKAKTNGTQYEKMTELSTDLKRAALAVNKPFFVLHQLSREVFSRQDKRPVLSDLRGSGQLEQDADFVLFVHRPAYYDEEADPTELQIIVAKNRHGETGKILKFCYIAYSQKIVER